MATIEEYHLRNFAPQPPPKFSERDQRMIELHRMRDKAQLQADRFAALRDEALNNFDGHTLDWADAKADLKRIEKLIDAEVGE